MYNSDSEADQSAMELVGYCTSQKEIRDIYQSIYLLQRAPGLPPCRTQPRRKAIQDILSSLKGQLHRCGHSTAIRDQEPQEEDNLDQIDCAPMKKLLGHPAKGHWIPLRLLRVTLKGLVKEEGTGHGPIPKTAAKVGVALGPGANLGATVE